jgi:hypothetical protein
MDNEERIQELIQQLDTGFGINLKAVIELEKIGKHAVPALIEALKNEDFWALQATIVTLRLIRDSSAVPALINTLKNVDWIVCSNVVYALGLIGDPSAIPALIKVMKGGGKYLPEKAAEALGHIINNFKNIDDVERFEAYLSEYLNDMKKKGADKKEIMNIRLNFAELKMKIAEKKNELTGKKDILLPDKPKPPEKGRMYNQLRRVRNG